MLKKSIFYLAFCLLIAQSAFAGEPPLYTINPILGDESFLETFGRMPTECDGEELRIKTHLFYVESILRDAEVDHLNRKQRKRRKQLLRELHAYAEAGNFPTNAAYPDSRRPCFIDASGNICAVGYLVEQSAGRAAAEAINEGWQYAFLMDMEGEDLEAWIESSGFSRRELAMIQPAYGTPDIVPKGYGIASGTAIGLSGGFATLSLTQPQLGRWVPAAGLATGLGTAALGFVDLLQIEEDPWWGTEPIRRKNLGFTNIGVGLGSALVNGVILFSSRKKGNYRPKSGVSALYLPPSDFNNTSYGVSYSRNF